MPAPTYNYMGTWNASSGSPPASSPSVGDVYLVSVAGNTATTPGISVWYAGDQAVYLGTTWHKLNGVNRDVPSILDWGADPTGALPSTSAIQAAIDFVVGAGGGDLLFPVGDYLHSDLTINFPGTAHKGYIRLLAVGDKGLSATASGGVRLFYTGTTGDHLLVNNCDSVEIDGLGFFQASGAAPTAGWAVHLRNGSRVTLRNFFISGAFNGLLIESTAAPLIENGDIQNIVGTNAMTVTGIDTVFIAQGRVDSVSINPGMRTIPANCTGITIEDLVNSITWTNVAVSYATYGLVLGSMSSAAHDKPSVHRFYDISIDNCGTGIRLRDCAQIWFTGLSVRSSTYSGIVADVTMDQMDHTQPNPIPYGGPVYFDSPLIVANGLHGAQLDGCPLINFTGGVIADNSQTSAGVSDGIHVTSPTAYFSVIGTRIGGDKTGRPDTTGNQQYGIYITSDVTAPSFIIDGVNALGNMTGTLLDASGATPDKFIGSIVGFNKFATSLPNVLVNGAFQIWQRGTSFSFGSATPCADYWVCKRGANSPYGVLSQQGGGPAASQYYARMQRASGDTSTNLLDLIQVLTTEDSLPFVGQQVVLSFYARKGSNFSGGASDTTMSTQIVVGTGTDQTATQVMAGGWSNQTIFQQIHTLSGSWQFFSQSVGIPTTLSSMPTSQIAIELFYTPSGTAGANDYVDIGLVSLQTDYGPPVIEVRPYWLELLAAQRRFRKSFPVATVPGQNVGSTLGAAYVRLSTGLSGIFGTKIPFTSRMRAAPTIITYNPSATDANWRDATNGADRTVTVGGIADSSFRIDGAGGVAGSANYIHWTADAELT